MPRTALRTDAGGDLVYVVDAGDRLRFKTVDVLRADHDDVVIGSGLGPGDRVCVSPLAAAVDGMAVRIVSGPEGESRLSQLQIPGEDVGGLDSAFAEGPK